MPRPSPGFKGSASAEVSMGVTAGQAGLLLDGGAAVISADRVRLGEVGRLYLDGLTGVLAWVAIRNQPRFGLAQPFAPLDGSRIVEGLVILAYCAIEVRRAPTTRAGAPMSAAEERALFMHYGVADAVTSLAAELGRTAEGLYWNREGQPRLRPMSAESNRRPA